ncbi:Flp family type IVb pilin [Streptomyces sp. NPDC050509]|uniref:Flp family type IVb pilin n=1 Tax=unclassified Streptomyces TaxID=2593676 RepID=UPI0036CD9C8E
MLKAAVDTQIRVNGWANTAVTRIQKRYANMDRGQTAFEYLGIILVVVAIIGGIVASGIGGKIQGKITEQVDKVKAG